MSKNLRLNKKDGFKLLKGLGIAIVGAVLTYGTEMLPQVDLGTWTPIVMAFWSVVVNFVRKWMFKQK